MPASSVKVDFFGGKIIETPAGGVAATIMTLVDSLPGAKETMHSQLLIGPSSGFITVNLNNITTAKVLVLSTDGLINVKIDGSAVAIPVNKLMVITGTSVTAITAENPHLSDTRIVEVYAATDSD